MDGDGNLSGTTLGKPSISLNRKKLAAYP